MELTVKLQADVVESFLAALTLDQGLAAAEQFLDKHLFPKLMVGVAHSMTSLLHGELAGVIKIVYLS